MRALPNPKGVFSKQENKYDEFTKLHLSLDLHPSAAHQRRERDRSRHLRLHAVRADQRDADHRRAVLLDVGAW